MVETTPSVCLRPTTLVRRTAMTLLFRRIDLLLACAALLVSAGSAVWAQAGAEKEELLAAKRQGEALKKQGRLALAIPHYEKAVALAPRVYGSEDASTADL